MPDTGNAKDCHPQIFRFLHQKTWLFESFLLRYLFWVIRGQLIENQLLLRQIYKEPLIISYKPGRSLKDILVRIKGYTETRGWKAWGQASLYHVICCNLSRDKLTNYRAINVMSLTGHRSKHLSGLHKQIKVTIKHTHFDQISEQ